MQFCRTIIDDMAAHTQIIDLYGIPACGKTTLARYMASHPAEGLKVSTMEDCMVAAMNDKRHLLLSISFKNLWASIRLKFSAPLDKKRRVIPLKSILLMGAYKQFILKYTDYDIVITDHGDIQSFVSLERGENLHESGTFLKACYNYLNVSLSNTYVYCKVDEEEALRRMNVRGREKGRIDIVSDPTKQLLELESESNRFDFWTTVLNERKAPAIVLDMMEPIPSVAEQLLSLIVRRQISKSKYL